MMKHAKRDMKVPWRVLHHLELRWDVLLSIEALEKANCLVKDLKQSFCNALTATFLEGMPDLDDAENALDWEHGHACDAVEALCDALPSDSSGATGDVKQLPGASTAQSHQLKSNKHVAISQKDSWSTKTE